MKDALSRGFDRSGDYLVSLATGSPWWRLNAPWRTLENLGPGPAGLGPGPGRLGSCPDGPGSCPDGLGSCPDGLGSCPDGLGSCPDGLGSCPDGLGSCPDGLGSCPDGLGSGTSIRITCFQKSTYSGSDPLKADCRMSKIDSIWYPLALIVTAMPCAWAGGRLHGMQLPR